MQRDVTAAQLTRLIRQHGAYEMARIVGEFDRAFLAAVRDGWDLTRWRVESASGALIFWHATLDADPIAIERDDTLDALRAEQTAIATLLRVPLGNLSSDLDAWSVHSRRAAEIDREIAARTGAPYGVATGRAMGRRSSTEQRRRGRASPDALILCVNAPETERARWEPVATAADLPVTLLMCPQEMPF